MAVEETYGVLLLGVMANTFLYGIVFYQYVKYFTSRSIRDRLWIRATVLALCLLDTFHTMSLIYMEFKYQVLSYNGKRHELLIHQWPCASTGVVVAVTALLTQLFLTYRILRLTNIYVYSALLFLTLASFASGMVYGIKVFSVKLVIDMHKLNKHMSVWLSIESTADILISGTLFYALSHSRTGFKRSNTVINRLLRAAIQTGLFPSIAATLSFTLLLTKPKTLFYDAFGFPISRLYTITLMDTLLCREELRGILDRNEHSLGSLLVNIKTDIHTIQVHELEGGDLSRTKQPQSHLHSNLTPGLSLMIDSEKNSREDFSEKSIDVEAQ